MGTYGNASLKNFIYFVLICFTKTLQKIVIPTEQLYDTCMMELKNLEWSDFAEFKQLMLEKYYIDEWMLDCLRKSPDDEEDTKKGGGGK